jgi:hypothetical protein
MVREEIQREGADEIARGELCGSEYFPVAEEVFKDTNIAVDFHVSTPGWLDSDQREKHRQGGADYHCGPHGHMRKGLLVDKPHLFIAEVHSGERELDGPRRHIVEVPESNVYRETKALQNRLHFVLNLICSQEPGDYHALPHILLILVRAAEDKVGLGLVSEQVEEKTDLLSECVQYKIDHFLGAFAVGCI